MNPLHPPHDDIRRARADGVQSRERLLLAAMRLFAEQGYAQTSTREIALAAGTNIAAISYYFGDKAGLYRAAFSEQPACTGADLGAVSDPYAPLRTSLLAFYRMLLAPLKQGDRARLCMRLWFREMLEPTGMWDEKIDNGIKPAHAELTRMLSRHLGVTTPNDDLERLAFCVVGMAVQLMVTRDVIDSISPQLLDSDAAVDTWLERIADYAEAMVNAERLRLAAVAHPALAALTPRAAPAPIAPPASPAPPAPPAPTKKTPRKKTA